MQTSGAKETTLYETLDVPASASADDIRRAFRSLAFLYHPDLAGAGGNDPSLFLRIREAYEVLIDVEKRRAYDETLRELERRREAERQAVRPVNVERPRARDFYSPGALERRLARPVEAVLVDASEVVRGPLDVFGAVEISLEESLRPANVTIVLPPECGAVQEKVNLRLPGRIPREAMLRVPGQGAASGSLRGDLYIEVVFGAHPDFRLCADSLFFDIPVEPWQAALGFEVTIPTLEGMERVTIPPMATTPCIKRLPGRGIFRKNGERGDLWINLKLEVPPPTSFRARRLWAELAEEYRRAQRPD
jgi:curved DNA-binding protein